jgi:transcriptional regulator with XRE-family HTH domain
MAIVWHEVGAALRRQRERAGFTQDALAAKVGVRWNTVARLETGHRRPSLDMLERLARALNCRVRDLLPEEDPPPPGTVLFATREPSLKGAPNFFRALVAEASDRRIVGTDVNTGRGIRLDYSTAGHELARHVEDYLEDEAKAEWDRIGTLNRPEFEMAVREFVTQEFPGCLALIPPKRRDRFFEGFVRYCFEQ